MEATNQVPSAIRGRWAVAAVFFVNGFLTGSWAPQIPVFLTRLDISEFTLGLLILLFGLGAVSSMAWCGPLIARHGSRSLVRAFASVAAFGLLAVALAPNVPLAAITMYLFGGLVGGLDVAMNANAVTVEKRLGRAVMSSSHGFWSLGGFAGGGLGGIAIKYYGHLGHAMAVTAVALVLIVFALRHLVADDQPVAREHRKFVLPRQATVYLVGLMAMFTMIPEGAVLDWAALYLKQELGAGIATASFAFAAFSGAMACVRFAGDGVRDRFGAVNTMRVSAVFAAGGMLVAALAPWAWLAIAAFAVSGVGLANMVPIAFSAGGNQPGMSPGVGMSIVTLMGYSGILIAPSAIGFVAERTGFSPVFAAVSVLLVVVFLMSGLVRAADFDHAKKPAE